MIEYAGMLVDLFDEYLLWPSRTDLTAASLGFLRLDKFYQLSFQEIANGSIQGIPSEPLTVEDMYDIAMIGVENWRPWSAVKWLEEAATRLWMGEVGGPGATSYAKVALKLAEVYDKFGDHHLAAFTAETVARMEPQSEYFQDLLGYYKEKNATYPSREIVPHKQFHLDQDQYESLCRGEVPEKPANVIRHLRCFTKPSAIPYHLAKIEVLHVNPNIYIFHDVVYEGEQNEIRKLARKNLERSTITHLEGYPNTGEFRISRTSWLYGLDPDAGDVLPRVYKRAQQLSGLKIELVDGLPGFSGMQVLNYGIGGMYGPHVDIIGTYKDDEYDVNNLSPLGDRIATWLLYLSDVEYGGATVFPHLGVRVPNLKGSAALWYNLNRDGTPDRLTLHAGCPVAIGSKWIANLWFAYNQQVFSKPCLPDNKQGL
ncbi:prolyl 4-hydroxylase subunit alpha-1-like isoform X2 [Lineus longissimus]